MTTTTLWGFCAEIVCDILDTHLLSLLSEDKVKASEVSEWTRKGLEEHDCFTTLLHLDEVTKAQMEQLLKSLPNTYASQLGERLIQSPHILLYIFFSALMTWFVTLASKMTGKEIPGVGMVLGGKIKKPKEEVEQLLQHFLAIADAMAKNWNWGYIAHLEEEAEVHLQHFLATADVMAKNRNCGYMAHYSILNKLLDDLHALAIAEDITISKEQSGKN